MKKLLNYLRYSNVVMLVRLNPISWNLIPIFRKAQNKEWGEPSVQFVIGWVCIKIVIYIDDGSW